MGDDDLQDPYRSLLRRTRPTTTTMKCNDCNAENFEPSELRSDLCPDCGTLRLKLMDGVRNGIVSMSEFKAIQRAMTDGSHTAAGCMMEALGMTAPAL